ncbi:MAG: TlpA family protein disulfide reductase [Carboxylicivirga sp.]|jgi:thiol-disulfide isomerase/thioredoxin|nr:TlpA family protein disulfide reductase [Carboxylicivirga sp.]
MNLKTFFSHRSVFKILTIQFIAVLALTACLDVNAKKYPEITVRIKNAKANKITIYNFNHSFNQKIEAKKDGVFNATIETDLNKLIFSDGTNKMYLYLEKGNHLKISYDADDFRNSLSFSGKGYEATMLIAEDRELYMKFSRRGTMALLKEKRYLERWDSINTARLELLKSTPNLSEDFKRLQSNDIRYFYLKQLPTYDMKHIQFTNNFKFKLSPGFLDEFKAMNDFSSGQEYMFSSSYRALASMHYAGVINKINNPDSLSWDLLAIKVLSEIPNDTIRNGLLLKYAGSHLNADNKQPKLYYDMWMAAASNDVYKRKVTRMYNSLKTFVDGQPSPKFVNYENHAGGTTSLDDLKGKYVYIDVWATWCGPCKAEIPHLKKVEKKYRNKNITFVGLSIDKQKDKEKWKAMVSEKGLKGIQLIADKDYSSTFVKEYSITGVPRFILIDPQGNIIRKEAPRPSDPRLLDLFNSLDI